MRWGVALVMLCCAACAETGEAPPRARTPEPAPAPAQPVDEVPVKTVDEYMNHHFRLVAAARDSLIRGDVAATRAALHKLAEGEYGMEVPQEWMRALYDLQAEAERGAQAQEIEEVARAVGAVSRQCGECHRTHRRQSAVGVTDAPYTAHGEETVAAAMKRHTWASRRLWLGITAPRDGAWIRGAEAMSEPWTPPPAEVASIDPRLVAAMQALRAEGPALREAQTLYARAEAYGKLLLRCAACHDAARK